MTTRLYTTWWSAVLVVACGPGQPPVQVASPENHGAIVWAALDTTFASTGLHWERRAVILVLDSTVPAGGALFQEMLEGPDREEMAQGLEQAPSWIRRAVVAEAPSHPVSLSSTSQTEVRLISRGEIDAVFGQPGTAIERWQAWDASYQDTHGWIGVSSAFLAPDGVEATVYVELHCGALCGSGVFVRLVRDGGRWHAREAAPIWAS